MDTATPTVESLKARNFDILCIIERLQIELRANNQKINEIEKPETASNGAQPA